MIDECAPRALKQGLAARGYECLTVQEAGWSGTVNGELLELADAKFDVLVTLDTNLRYQQKLDGRKIAIVILRARSNRLSDLSPLFSSCANAIQSIKPGEIVYVGTAP